MDFNQLIDQAQESKWGRWKLNFLLDRLIPFNKPHRFRLLKLNKNEVQVRMPYRKSNLNHIKGLHACGLATAAEFASGLLLLYRLEAKKYRLIMKHIEVEYHYQGKSTAIASFILIEEKFQSEIVDQIAANGIALSTCEIELHDSDQNLLCIVKTTWQIKDWKKVKTKAS